MKNQIRLAPIVPVAKLYKPSFEIVNVYVDHQIENDQVVWYLNAVNVDEQVFRYRLEFHDPA